MRWKNGSGLLIWGDVGTGKSFFAGCIANALLEKGVPVLMTNFSRILNTLTGMHFEDRNQFINNLNRYSLLIIDDLGMERNSDFALEQVFNVIDSRYRSKKQVYSDSGALLAGQPPLSFPEGITFENGITRTVSGAADDFYVLDYWLHFGWDDGVWVRGVTPMPDTADILNELADIALLLLPLMVIVSGLGAYLIARSTFRPIDRMIRTVGEISEGRDLSRRIGLPSGRDEISRLGQAFDSMFARLETSFEAEKQFTSDASHELRTPVAVILAQCGDARRNAQTPEQYAEAIDVVERQAKRMSDMIARLLQMTRLEQGTQRITMEHADISSLVEVICGEQPQLPRGITLQSDIQPDAVSYTHLDVYKRQHLDAAKSSGETFLRFCMKSTGKARAFHENCGAIFH